MKEHSKYPFRSARLESPETAIFVNNYCVLRVPRGTYRLQAINASSANGGWVYFAVGKDDLISHFTAAPTRANVRAEVLLAVGLVMWGATFYPSGFSAVEVDVLDDEVISMWSPDGVEIIKYVKVGELPVEDPELEGRRG